MAVKEVCLLYSLQIIASSSTWNRDWNIFQGKCWKQSPWVNMDRSPTCLANALSRTMLFERGKRQDAISDNYLYQYLEKSDISMHTYVV